jgi:hypothetical protein
MLLANCQREGKLDKGCYHTCGHLKECLSDDEVSNVARVRTITVLTQLNARRIGYIFTFLREAGLMSTASTSSMVNLKDADLHAVEWDQANLNGADLHEANLNGASLFGTNLSEARLNGATITGGFALSPRNDALGLTEASSSPTWDSARIRSRMGQRKNSCYLSIIPERQAKIATWVRSAR